MARHNDFGKEGEAIAARWLESRGFEILARNWREGRTEIDLVAARDDKLRIVEVKARHGDGEFGFPEESVDRRKLARLMGAAVAFAARDPRRRRWQIDILAVTVRANGTPDIFWLEDVYCW